MGDEMSVKGVVEGLGEIPKCDSKVEVGAKRSGEGLEEDSDVCRKRVKMRDLQSVLQSEGIATHDPETSKTEEIEEHMDIIETQGSQVLDKNAGENADARISEGALKKQSMIQVDGDDSKPLDLNSEMYTDENSGHNNAVVSLEDSRKHFSYGKGKAWHERVHKTLGSTRLDLNAEDVASSANHVPCTYRSQNNLKTKDTSNPKSKDLECGRTAGRLEEKDALKKWKEMKQNGFMSPSYGGIPAAPKQRGRKSKNEALKQKMEQAKKEQVDRFTKIAAPSGLLNGLNPGIINHVRNSKQVHSIIQALVRSEKRESRRQACEMGAGNRDISRSLEQEKVMFSGIHGSRLSCEIASFSSMPESKPPCENHLSHDSSSLFSSEECGWRDSITEEGRFCSQTSLSSYPKHYSEDDILALKLASSNIVSESTSCLSNGDSANGTSVDTLSVKAATVASQWLQLLHQDIKGRLAALRRSKKRVHAVITTELPFLLSKEFPSNQGNDPYIMKDPASCSSNKSSTELHQAQWSKLFKQMDTSLSEEEKQLECWFEQVNKMLLHCDEGLQHVQWNSVFEMHRLGALDNNFRSKNIDPEKDLSVRAAAASIYSTCNISSGRENVSCC